MKNSEIFQLCVVYPTREKIAKNNTRHTNLVVFLGQLLRGAIVNKDLWLYITFMFDHFY